MLKKKETIDNVGQLGKNERAGKNPNMSGINVSRKSSIEKAGYF